MIYFNPRSWTGSFSFPNYKDVRWIAFGLLFIYILLGLTILGFSRTPLQVILLLGTGSLLDVLFHGLFHGKWVFPLSALISCSSLVLLLNFSYGLEYLWLPVVVCIASKYIFTFKGKHFFNPSLFAIVTCILFGNEFITLTPSYQWYGDATNSWVMGVITLSGALLLLVVKIKRGWLVGSFLIIFVLQTVLRAFIMKNVIPPETLFIGAITSPAFFLFTFYMITDPATSPKGRAAQILVGSSIGLLDLFFHLKFSLFTFFYAGMSIAVIRFIYFHLKSIKEDGMKPFVKVFIRRLPRHLIITILIVSLFFYIIKKPNHPFTLENLPLLSSVSSSHSGLGFEKSDIFNQTDPRIANVAKWIFSVGDAVAVADVNLDGLPDLFLTQTLKSKNWRGKIHINKGDFKFEKLAIPSLEKYLGNQKLYGLPSFAFFLDYDNDGDQDLFVGFGFGPSHLFENKMIPEKVLRFVEKEVPFLQNNNSTCLSANAFDFNNDGYLDILICNAMNPYLPDYKDNTPLNIFDLPKPKFGGDRRMFHFMHESWHNANNGGENYLLINEGSSGTFKVADNEVINLKETRWSLSIGTLDINNDGFTDIYIANDFGRDDCYLNINGKYFERQSGKFYGDIGLDTYKGMNTSIGDLDRNVKEDIYVSNVHHSMQAEGSLLWMNETVDNSNNVLLKEKAWQKNLLNPNRFGWGAAIVDLNLDGWLDVIQANGMVSDEWDKKYDTRMDYWYLQAQIARTGPEIHSYADMWADIRGASIYEDELDCVFLNNKGSSFHDVASEIGLISKRNTRGIAPADFDNDGDPDLLITDQFGLPQLYENKIKQKSWVGIELRGNGIQTNKDAIGTKVWLCYTQEGKKVKQYREMRLVNGFMAMGDTRLLFGFGNIKNISNIYLEVKWHNGNFEIIKNIKLNRHLVIQQKNL